jgi:hypothetical protein
MTDILNGDILSEKKRLTLSDFNLLKNINSFLNLAQSKM